MKLLTIANSKTTKGEAAGYLTGILYLAPHTIASEKSLCPFSSPGCRAVCLYSAGRGAFKSIQDARTIKTLHWLNNPEGFIEQLVDDIKALQVRAQYLGLIPVVRLNGTSDIPWERVAPELFTRFKAIQFYDYTKWPLNSRTIPDNYHLTYSYSERLSPSNAENILIHKKSLAIVGDPKLLTHYAAAIVDGDAHDLRFLDRPGSLVVLRPKGKARRARNNPFVRGSSGKTARP